MMRLKRRSVLLYLQKKTNRAERLVNSVIQSSAPFYWGQEMKRTEWEQDAESLADWENETGDKEVEECYHEIEKLKWNCGGE